MLDLKPIELSDRETINKFFRSYNPETSEFTFTNLFIWRDHYNFRWATENDVLFITAETEDGKKFALPPLGKRSIKDALSMIELQGSIERADKKFVDGVFPSGKFKIEEMPNHFDYVYRTSDLVELAGSKYHAKRNHIAKAIKAHELKYEQMSDHYVGQCLELAGSWCQFRKCQEDASVKAECEAVVKALTNFRALKLQGGVLFADGKLVAFTLGELLNRDTAVIHMEKADLADQDIYAVINQRFCEGAWKNVRFINREQDLGLEGLRKAKMSYHPCHMAKKFEVSLC